MGGLSLKTIWFCVRDSLSRKDIGYNDEIARELFCSSNQQLSNLILSDATDRDYEQAMDSLLGEESNRVQFQRWRQLNLILRQAAQERWIRSNPISALIDTKSSRATEEEREVRNALGKKTFTTQEEAKMLGFICADTDTEFDSRTAKRYEVESIWLSGAIRLFTGMTSREVCSLQWGDFTKIPHLDGYQLSINRTIQSGKKSGDTSDLSRDWKRFRLVPVAPALAIMLNNRKQYLKWKYSLSDKALSELPIAFKTEAFDETDLQPKKLQCDPRDISKRCKQFIETADIPERILELPIDGDEVQTDISKYAGDIFRANFKYRANHTCAMDRGEINYILGIAAPDTYSRHYCDYTHDFIQFSMSKKLNRWTSIHWAGQQESPQHYKGEFNFKQNKFEKTAG